MKPTLVADEMFPEGAGPFLDIEEVSGTYSIFSKINFTCFFVLISNLLPYF